MSARIVTIALLLSLSGVVMARNVDVDSDTALRKALADAKPGDTISIRPGVYRGGIHVALAGEKDKPITITSANPDDPAIIEGNSGLHIAGARYVTLRDLIVRKSTGNGINIDDAGKMDHSAVGVRVERCQILDTGPKGNLDGLKLSGLKDFIISDCVISGWGGSAIDMVGCVDATISGTTLTGKPGFDQSTGIQMKGGTRNIRVTKNTFKNAGARALNVGGSTGLAFFRPLDAAYEAKDITVDHSLIEGSEAPVAFVGVDGAVFKNNILLNPGKWVMRILQESRDERFARCRNVRFEKNLIIYSQKQVRTIANIGPDTQAETFIFDRNWWFCKDGPTPKPDLPARETNGVYGQDPQLDKNNVPQNPDAKFIRE